jgi:hypothetical protein
MKYVSQHLHPVPRLICAAIPPLPHRSSCSNALLHTGVTLPLHYCYIYTDVHPLFPLRHHNDGLWIFIDMKNNVTILMSTVSTNHTVAPFFRDGISGKYIRFSDGSLLYKTHEKQSLHLLVRLEVLTALGVTSSVFWGITTYSLLKLNQHFGGTCHLHLQSKTIRQARNQHEAVSKQGPGLLADCFMLAPCLTCLPKCRLTFNQLYGIMSQKKEL